MWRAGGAVALHAERGKAVTVICLSYGERGESAKLRRQEGMILERVKAERQKEAEAAAKHLGVANLGDYPITLAAKSLYRLIDVYRAIHDHPAVTYFEAREAKEAQTRARLQAGELALDIYARREKLATKRLVYRPADSEG